MLPESDKANEINESTSKPVESVKPVSLFPLSRLDNYFIFSLLMSILNSRAFRQNRQLPSQR